MTRGTDETSKTLDERGQTHGDYNMVALIAQSIKSELRGGDRWCLLTYAQKEALDLTATKMARIVCGNGAGQAEHWGDIKGYAQLVIERIGTPLKLPTTPPAYKAIPVAEHGFVPLTKDEYPMGGCPSACHYPDVI